MHRLSLFCSLLLLAASASAASPKGETGEGGREGISYVMLGAGSSNQLDTYLSPMEYKGGEFTFLTGRDRLTGLAHSRVSFQSILLGTFSSTENPAKTADDWGGRLSYTAGCHYNWHPANGLTLKAGALAAAHVGFLYNQRNGNNPAQGRGSLEIAASAAAAYAFHIRKLPLAIRYQADLPVIGCMFSPQFGQSYYELYQGNRDNNVCLSHPGNALSLRQQLMLDLVFPRTTLRLGYLGDIRQSHVNNIKTHDINHSFMIGYVRHFRILPKTERKEDSTL